MKLDSVLLACNTRLTDASYLFRQVDYKFFSLILTNGALQVVRGNVRESPVPELPVNVLNMSSTSLKTCISCHLNLILDVLSCVGLAAVLSLSSPGSFSIVILGFSI